MGGRLLRARGSLHPAVTLSDRDKDHVELTGEFKENKEETSVHDFVSTITISSHCLPPLDNICSTGGGEYVLGTCRPPDKVIPGGK